MTNFYNMFLRALFLLTAAYSFQFAHADEFSIQFDRDVPAVLKTGIETDLKMIGDVKLSSASPFHRKVFGQEKQNQYVNWFSKRILRVGVSGCGDAIAVACVVPKLDPNKMFITENYSKRSHPQIARISILFHEARHSERENGFWSHANCPVPFLDPQGKDVRSIWTGASLAGEDACDETPFGSYGISVIFLKNISKFCTSCNEKTRADAEIYGSDQLIRISNPAASREMIKDFGTEKARHI